MRLESEGCDEVLVAVADDDVEVAALCRRCEGGDETKSPHAPSFAGLNICAQCAGTIRRSGCGHFVFPTIWVLENSEWRLLMFRMRSGSGMTFNGMDPHFTARLCCQRGVARFEKQHVLKEIAHAAIAAQAGAPRRPPPSLLLLSLVSLFLSSIKLSGSVLCMQRTYRCRRERQSYPVA